MGLGSLITGGLVDSVAGGVKGVAEVFRPNAEASEQRAASARSQALAQLAAEFAQPRRNWFDSAIDGLNRLPRPAMALGTIGLFVWAMSEPIGFAARMQGLATIPEPLWWLMGSIVAFYFGARELSYSRAASAPDFEQVEAVARSISRIEAIDDVPSTPLTPQVANVRLSDAEVTERIETTNPALAEFMARAGR